MFVFQLRYPTDSPATSHAYRPNGAVILARHGFVADAHGTDAIPEHIVEALTPGVFFRERLAAWRAHRPARTVRPTIADPLSNVKVVVCGYGRFDFRQIGQQRQKVFIYQQSDLSSCAEAHHLVACWVVLILGCCEDQPHRRHKICFWAVFV